MRFSAKLICVPACLFVACGFLSLAVAAEQPSDDAVAAEARMRKLLDAPLLFAKRHSYSGIHIYDTYYKWPPGGGGIYVVENPAAPRAEWKIRTVIDSSSENSLGLGVYNDPELSWDATRLLFCFKGEPDGSTSIYEIGVDGSGLRRLTDPRSTLGIYKGGHAGQHDVTPSYLPDGRIVFLSTRPSGLVPCANSGVAILHVMNADGSDIHPISVNNVNEFDPAPLPDGRILFGRWEYVDKNALTIQSLWTMNPDGAQETAFFANNMVFPESILDARPVPDSHLIVGTFAKHNSTPRGSIAMVDPRLGKNGPQAIFNLEHPEDPTFDRGDSCEPWPLSEDVVLFSGRSAGEKFNSIQIIDRAGHCFVLHSSPEICLHSPMLVKPRPRPPLVRDTIDRNAKTGWFFVQDIYQGLTGIKPGEVKWLRVLEETSRTSERTDGANPYNQTFLISSALAFSAKNFLGMVPVEEDGSAHFEVPAGRAVYLQALDAEGRLIQSMRTFVQAAPGTTRSCVGCHEQKSSTSVTDQRMPPALNRQPSRLVPESWGSGYLDYSAHVQPVLDRHCVRCHGGEEDIAGGMDLSGGWTEHFNISYENLTNRCETQLTAYWISGIDCMNGTALWSSKLFAPRTHGSGSAPLAELLTSGHDGHIPDLPRAERDLLLAWIDTNGVYYGSWDRTASGCAIKGWSAMRGALTTKMNEAGCLECHGSAGKITYFESDWVNLENPSNSRILRAPLAEGGEGNGLAWCRHRAVGLERQRVHLLWKGYAHAVQPPEAFPRREIVRPDRGGEPVVSFDSTSDQHYRDMLAIIDKARADALVVPRVDMPGAEVLAGTCRIFRLPELGEKPPVLDTTVDDQGIVHLVWGPSAQTIGLEAELHRSSSTRFTPNEDTLLLRTPLFRYTDREAPIGQQQYALVMLSPNKRGKPAYASVDVPRPLPPQPPGSLTVVPASCIIRLRWQSAPIAPLGYHVYRAKAGTDSFEKITLEPIRTPWYADTDVETDVAYRYIVRSVGRLGVESEPTPPVEGVAQVISEPVFEATFDDTLGRYFGGEEVPAKLHYSAKIANGQLDISRRGHVTFARDGRFELAQPLSVECWVRFTQPGKIPVVLCCGHWQQAGWFVQRLGNTWRWHVGGVDCDGGTPVENRWFHLAATYDGRTARLYEDGKQIGEQTGQFNTAPWPGDLHIGQYGQPTADFQVTGHISGVKIYHRPLEAEEISKAALDRPE